MALNKLKYNSLNLTPAANKAIGFDSDADALEATLEAGAMTFISKVTASSSGTVDFTSGIDSTYKEYLFLFNDIHPATDDVVFSFQVDTGTNTSYNQVVTSTSFAAQHGESGSPTELSDTGTDRRFSQQQVFQPLSGHNDLGNDNDQALSGTLHIFNPSSTTFVKHFLIQASMYHESNANQNCFVGGYANTTSAITSVRFKMVAGTIDAGTIKLYGIKDS